MAGTIRLEKSEAELHVGNQPNQQKADAELVFFDALNAEIGTAIEELGKVNMKSSKDDLLTALNIVNGCIGNIRKAAGTYQTTGKKEHVETFDDAMRMAKK